MSDYKYSGSDTAAEESIREFLMKVNYAPERIELVVKVVKGVGFKSELKSKVFQYYH